MSYPTYAPITLWNRLSAWSQNTFGTDAERGPIGPLKHLRKEVDEALADVSDKTEYADCLLLIFDAARRAGMEMEELFDVALNKLSVNEKRTYPRPTTDEPSEHVRVP